MIRRTFPLIAVAAAGALAETPVFERALPQANLNESAGLLRSNVRWSWYRHGFIGDDFRIGGPGERWLVERLRVWAVPGAASRDPNALGEFYEDLRLYFGEDSVTPVLSGRFAEGAADTGNPRIRISEAAGSGMYDEFGRFYRVWQIEFVDPGLELEGGRTYRFGVWGLGREKPGEPGKTHAWFNLASNAALSESRQDGADGLLLSFDGAGRFEGAFDSDGRAWNKSSDLNVQVFAHQVVDADIRPERAALFGSASLDTGHIEVQSMRLGGRAPLSYRLEDANGDGYADLMLGFPAGARGCLSGRRLDGRRFASCSSSE